MSSVVKVLERPASEICKKPHVYQEGIAGAHGRYVEKPFDPTEHKYPMMKYAYLRHEVTGKYIQHTRIVNSKEEEVALSAEIYDGKDNVWFVDRDKAKAAVPKETVNPEAEALRKQLSEANAMLEKLTTPAA